MTKEIKEQHTGAGEDELGGTFWAALEESTSRQSGNFHLNSVADVLF